MARRRSRKPLVSFLTLDQSYSNQIKSILDQSAKDLDRQILAANARSLNPLSQIQLEAQRSAIKAQLNQDWSKIGSAIASGKLDAADASARIATDLQSPILSQILPPDAVQALAASEAARATNGLESVLARLESSYKPLANSVYINSALTTGRVDALVNSALARGLNARQFAGEVAAYVSPNVPGGMSYAALRLARTEINNAFHATTVDRYQQNKVIDRVAWNLSKSHPDFDECDVYARATYRDTEVPEKPHPQCFCYITPELPDPNQFMDDLFNGIYDDTPWMVDALKAGVVAAGVLGAEVAERRAALYVERGIADVIKNIAHAGHVERYYLAIPQRAGSLLALDPLETAKKGLDLYHDIHTVEGLLSRYEAGYQVVEVIPEGSNPVFVVELNDGSRAIVKQLGASGAGASDEGARELLSYRLLKDVIRVDGMPETILTDDGFMVQEFVKGRMGYGEYSEFSDLTNGREIGLFDWIANNTDRHELNYIMDDAGGRVIPIDHGFSFSHTVNWDGSIDRSLDFANDFTSAHFLIDDIGRVEKSYSYSVAELEAVRKRLLKTQMEFARLGHIEWYDNTLAALDEMLNQLKPPIAIAKQKELESLSLARWRKDVEELQDSLNSGYAIDQYGITQGINETYKVEFADGTFGIEKNIPMDEIQKELVAFHGFRAMGVDEMPAIVIKITPRTRVTALERFKQSSIDHNEWIDDPIDGISYRSTTHSRWYRGISEDEADALLLEDFNRFSYGGRPDEIILSEPVPPKMIMRYAEGDIRAGNAWVNDVYSEYFDHVSSGTPTEIAEFHAEFPNPGAYEAYKRAEATNGKEMGLFDFLFQNTDRHDGNWLFEADREAMVPIDHGFLFGDGFWTGAAPNYQFRKGWVDSVLDVTSLPDVYEVGRFGSKWSSGLPGPGMKFTTTELREIKRRLEKTQGYFLSINKPQWYRQVMYNMNDLLGRAEIYEANALRTKDDVIKWAEAEYKRLNNLNMSYDEFQAAIKVAEKNLAKAEWYGYDVEEYIAREQLGLIPPVTSQEAADIAQWIQGGGRMGVRNLHLEAQDYVRNIEASRLRVQVYKDALAHELEQKITAQESTVVSLLRAQGWPDELPEGIKLKQYAERIVEGMTDPVNGNFNPAMTVATFLQIRQQTLRDMLSMAGSDPEWAAGIKDALAFDPTKKIVVMEGPPAGLVPHIEQDQTDKVINRQQRNALLEYGHIIGWNSKLRGGELGHDVANFEGKTQFIDQAIWNHPLAKAKTFVRAEADEDAVARWQAFAAQGSYHDQGFVSVLEKGRFFGTQRGMEDLAAFIDNEWEAHAFVWITYKLKSGDLALDLRGVGIPEYIEGEHLLPRDMRWKIVDSHHGIEQVEGIDTMVWHYTVEEDL